MAKKQAIARSGRTLEDREKRLKATLERLTIQKQIRELRQKVKALK